MTTRFGIGYDAHALEEGVPLTLGGVRIPSESGLSGAQRRRHRRSCHHRRPVGRGCPRRHRHPLPRGRPLRAAGRYQHVAAGAHRRDAVQGWISSGERGCYNRPPTPPALGVHPGHAVGHRRRAWFGARLCQRQGHHRRWPWVQRLRSGRVGHSRGIHHRRRRCMKLSPTPSPARSTISHPPAMKYVSTSAALPRTPPRTSATR